MRYYVFWWLTYWWYFEILSIFMVDVLVILWDTKYFYGWRTGDTLRYQVFLWLSYCDTLRYFVFWWLTYCWHFEILCILMVDVLLILWDTSYFDGWRTGDTLRYFVFWWLTYWWYFEIISILMVDVLLILWDTNYFDGWRTGDTLRY